MKRLIACALLGAAVSALPARADEWLALTSSTGASASLLNLDNGRSRALPASEYEGKRRDHWTVSRSGREALRKDAMGNIGLFDLGSGRATGGFALERVRGARDPELFAELQLSHDGRFLLGYWRPEHGEGDPRLVVFNRQGQVLLQDSPFSYKRSAHTSAFTWLPDGRAFYLAGRTMAVIDRSGHHTKLGTLDLPPGVTTEMADRPAISPDGRWVALALRSAMGDGNRQYNHQIFVAPLQGGPVRPLALLSPRARNASHPVDLVAPMWSPDGREVAFTPQSAVCHSPQVVPADAERPVLINEFGEGAKRVAPRSRGPASERLQNGCFLLAWWRD